jgi:hypothetical protein
VQYHTPLPANDGISMSSCQQFAPAILAKKAAFNKKL